MKTNNLKKIFIAILAFFFVCSLGMFTLVGVSADGTSSTKVFKMNEGASVRLVENSNGIRFSATLSEYDTANEYGFVIVPKAYIVDNEITGNYVTELNALAKAGTISEPIILSSAVHEVDGQNVIKGSISNILYANINLEFVGIGFEYDGTNYNYASFDSLDDISRTAPVVVSKALNDLYYNANLDEEIKTLYQETEDILKNYINESINAKAGLTEDESDQTTPTWELGFANDAVDVDFGKTAQLSINTNLPSNDFIYTSSNANVIVDENGLVTANCVGSATITVKCLGVEDTCTINVANVEVADGYVVDFNDEVYECYIEGGSYSSFWKADAVSAEYVASGVTGADGGDAMKVTVDIAKCREGKGMSYFVINFLANKGNNLDGEVLQIRFRATYNDGADNVDPFLYDINGKDSVINGLDGSADVTSVNLDVSEPDSNGWRILSIPTSSITDGAENISTLGIAFYQYVGVDDGIGEIYLDHVKVLKTLDAPSNLSYSDGTLTWDAVTNASSYVVKYDNTEYITADTSYAVPTGKSVTVKAVAEGYLDSEWSAAYATVIVPAGYLADYNSAGYEGMITNGIIDNSGADQSYWLPTSVSAEYVASDVVGAKDGDALVVTINNNKNGYSTVTFGMPAIAQGSLDGTIIHIRYRLMEGADSKQAFLYSLSGSLVSNIASMSTADGGDGWQILAISVTDPYSITSVGLGFHGLAKSGASTLEIDYVKVIGKLATPTNLAYSNGTLTWGAVTNANSYVVKYDDTEYTTAETSYEVPAGKTVTIKAVAEGYLDSDYSVAFVTGATIPAGYLVDYNDALYEGMVSNVSFDSYWTATSVSATYAESGVTGAENEDALVVTVNNNKNGYSTVTLNMPAVAADSLTGTTINVRYRLTDADTYKSMYLYVLNGDNTPLYNFSKTEETDGWIVMSFSVTDPYSITSIALGFYGVTANGASTLELDYVKVV